MIRCEREVGVMGLVPGTPISHMEEHLQFHDSPHLPQVVPSTPPLSAYESRSRGPWPGAPTTPHNAQDGSQPSVTIAGARDNREQLIEQLSAENAALRASRDQKAVEVAQALSMPHASHAASGATVAQISVAAENEIGRTRGQSESVSLQQQQRFQTDAHHALAT
eukprot:6434573-Amphidinium_carterae.2